MQTCKSLRRNLIEAGLYEQLIGELIEGSLPCKGKNGKEVAFSPRNWVGISNPVEITHYPNTEPSNSKHSSTIEDAPRRTQLQPVRKVNGRLSPLDTSPGKRGVQRKPVNMQSTQKITHLRHESFPLEETKIRRVHVSALYCISMQLTLDYRERTKGQPKAPKAQTLHHCTGQRPCEQFFHSTQRVQGSPFTNRRQPAGEPQIPESLRR